MMFNPVNKPDPRLPDDYRNNGIYNLMRMGRDDSCQIIGWQLAMHTAKVFHGQRAEPCKFRIGDLHNIFLDDSNE